MHRDLNNDGREGHLGPRDWTHVRKLAHDTDSCDRDPRPIWISKDFSKTPLLSVQVMAETKTNTIGPVRAI